MKFIRRIWWFIRYRLTGRPMPHRTIYVEELPESLGRTCVYIVGENGFYWFVALICPCGCGEVLYMNLLEERRPRWSFSTETSGTISLTPSVWRKKGCGSHFFFRRGLVDWCAEDCESLELPLNRI